MIRKGEVDVVLQDKKKKDYVLSRLQAGEFFGEIELLRGGKSIANVRAGEKPVEVLSVPRQEFLRVINESPITAEAIGKIVQKRLEEKKIADQRSASR